MRKFHKHQLHAFQATSQLVMALVAVIVGTILLSAVVVSYLLVMWHFFNDGHPFDHINELILCFGMTATVCLFIVACGSGLKFMQLQAGGKIIAREVGGTLVDDPGQDIKLLRLLNIVEEISIASGVPVPPVYVLEYDRGINAFAAGYEPADAVIGVTRGAIEDLSREQMQGVIAHEFSHILNGDMRLNLRMVGILHGLLSISMMCETLIQYAHQSLNMKNDREAFAAIMSLAFYVVAIVLWPVGIGGALLSLFVKAATSRHREYLADAYAVQFTRNPEALAGAMKRIAGHKDGSRVRSPKAMEASHMFFANGCRFLHRMFASHPPISERIHRLDPNWDGVPLFKEETELSEYSGAHAHTMGLISNHHRQECVAIVDNDLVLHESVDDTEANRTRQYSLVSDVRFQRFTEQAMATLPEPLLKIAADPEGTPLVLFGLWVLHAEDQRLALDLIPSEYRNNVERLQPTLKSLHESQHVLLLDTAVEMTRNISGPSRRQLSEATSRLMEHSETENMFHWMWSAIVGPQVGASDLVRRSRYGELSQVAGACELLLSRICHAGTENDAMSSFAFARGMTVLGMNNLALRPKSECTWQKFMLSVEVVSQLSAGPRRMAMLACSSAMTSDQEITCDESYMIRGICQRLDFEVPNVLPGQPVAPGA